MNNQEFFRGYVVTKDKKPIKRFTDTQNLDDYDNVKGFTSYAGVLREDTVLIDIDDYEQSEKLLKIVNDLKVKCFVIETKRGKHFYFKNNESIQKCSTGAKLACGLIADIKVGIKNSVGILKIEGKERKILYDKLENENYSEIPFWLKPITVNKEFNGLEEGDGRNSNLFSYILTLQSNHFTKEQIKEICTIINKYIFKKPLSNKELNTILRDEAFNKPNYYDDKGKLNINIFARVLIENEHICRMESTRENNTLYLYQNGGYIYNCNEIQALIVNKYIENLRSPDRNEVIKMLELITERKPPANERYINFKNGIYDLETDVLLPPSPNYFIPNQIPWNYNKNAKSELVDKALNDWTQNDTELRNLLEEVVGSCMYRSNKIGQCFILVGNKDNGKSTFLDILKIMLGRDNYSAVSLHDMDAKYKNTSIYGKLANLGDDIGETYIKETDTLKKMITGNTVKVENKNKDPFDFDNVGKLIFCANNVPKINDKTGALIDKRLTLIPFDKTFTVEIKDLDFKEKFNNAESMEYLIQLGIKGIKRVLENRGFTKSRLAKEMKEQYKYDNDIVARFIDDYGAENIHFEDCTKIFNSYRTFCNNENNNYSNTPKCLNEGIKRILGYEKINCAYRRSNDRGRIYYYAKSSEQKESLIQRKIGTTNN